ncbi:MAG: GlsB/YeaQ/YmgE family stress response membrane protein [Polyangiaceae bacterium]
MLSFLVFLLFGLVVGALARFLVPGKEEGGWTMSLAFGVLGAILAGFVGRFLGFYREGEAAGFLMSLMGAVVLVAGYHAVSRSRAHA